MDKFTFLKCLSLFLALFLCVSCSMSTFPCNCSGSCTDNDITTTVQVRIAADPCLRYQFIRVSTFERTVTLEGKVENYTQRKIAIYLAKSTPGVKCVVCKLGIKGPYNI